MGVRVRFTATLLLSIILVTTGALSYEIELAPPVTEDTSPCPHENMVLISTYWGSYCIDQYEASQGRGGKAESKPGVHPLVRINWNDAKAACESSGKRLCLDWEWMAACNLDGEKYFLTEEEEDEAYGCHTSYGSSYDDTGSHAKCRSDAGVHDMIGNVWEWTDELVPNSSWAWVDGYVGEILGETKAKYGDDYLNGLGGGEGNAFLRGGGRGAGGGPSWRGCFNLDLNSEPSRPYSRRGFRCCAGPGELSIRQNGEACLLNESCMSGNCRNDICCPAGYTCCSSDADCPAQEECRTERHYCIPRPTTTPTPTTSCPEGMALVSACVNYATIDGYQKDEFKVALDPIGGTGCVQKSFCIDKYEASVDGDGKALSVAGVKPKVSISQTAAKAACEAGGKRLCYDWEWMAACNLDGERYFLIEEEDDERYSCNTYNKCSRSNCDTGHNAKCKSDAGVHDMIGNVWEWTDELVPNGSWAGDDGYVGEILGESKAKYGDDYLYGMGSGGEGNVFLRGGGWYRSAGNSPRPGCFDLDLTLEPSLADSLIGFRCCAGP